MCSLSNKEENEVYECIPLVASNIPKLCQGFSWSGNDSGRIKEISNWATTCTYFVIYVASCCKVCYFQGDDFSQIGPFNETIFTKRQEHLVI